MFNKYFQIAIFTITIGFGILSNAGGVGSGGGGTTIPDPSTAEEIANALDEESRFMIETWLNRQEKNYWEQSPIVRSSNPLKKLFQAKPGISERMGHASVELRMNQPCFDSANQPVDGSISGRSDNDICMSPFSMAPKLSKYNYKAEAFALLVHEFSHYLGADENEAVAIQKLALNDFLAKIPRDISYEMVDLCTNIFRDIISPLEAWAFQPEIFKNRSDKLNSLLRSYQEVENAYNSDKIRFLLVSALDESYFAAEYIRFTVMDYFVCSKDSTLGSTRQGICKNMLDQAFNGTSVASIETIANNLGIIMDRISLDVAKSVTIQNPKSWQILGLEFLAANSTFHKIRGNLESRFTSRIYTYRR